MLWNKKALGYIKQKLVNYEDNIAFLSIRKRKYMYVLFNVSMVYQYCNLPLESIQTLKKIIEKTQKDIFYKKHQNVIIGLIEVQYLATFLTHHIQDSFIIDYLEKNQLDIEHIPFRRQSYVMKYRGLFYWFNGDRDKALDYFHETYNIKSGGLSAIDATIIKLYEALIHIDLGNYLLLSSIVRQLQYQFPKLDANIIEHEGWNSILSFIKTIVKKVPQNKKQQTNILKEWMGKHPNYIDFTITTEFRFKNWLHAYLKNKTIVEILDANKPLE